jgi:hypothetical protein
MMEILCVYGIGKPYNDAFRGREDIPPSELIVLQMLVDALINVL